MLDSPYLSTAIICLLLVCAGLWVAFSRRRLNFRVSYVYDGLPRIQGVLMTDSPIPMHSDFYTLYTALGFVKRLADKGYPAISLVDNHDSQSYLRLELHATEEQGMQYEVAVGSHFPVPRSRLIRMLHSDTLSTELRFQETVL